MEHRPVTDAVAPLQIRHIQEALHLLDREIMHQPGLGFLGRDGENTPTVFQQSRHAILEKVHKGLDRHQSGITRAGAVMALGLQIVEELHDQWRIELLQRQRRRRQLQSRTGELEQELECIGIAVTGMLARTALQRQTFTEKGTHVGGNRCHTFSSFFKKASHACAMLPSSCGVLAKYQYVLLTRACPIYVVKASM